VLHVTKKVVKLGNKHKAVYICVLSDDLVIIIIMVFMLHVFEVYMLRLIC